MIGLESYRIVIDHQQSGDYRHSDISVQTFDNMNMEQPHVPLRATLLGNGTIRLYREFDSSGVQASTAGDSTMMLIIALPTYFTASDLLGFIGSQFLQHLTHIRILKSKKPNRFLVLLKFQDAPIATDFQLQFDGKAFNAMEPEKCHVVHVKEVVIDPAESGEGEALLPFIIPDPFTAPENPSISTIELPSCPVCLERLDYEVSGLLTIPCQHTFHCQCLSQWRDDTCPVCRYTSTQFSANIRQTVRRLSTINHRNHEDDLPAEELETCMQCSDNQNLWICLICGNVGCSRYAPNQHSLQHFIETGHCFAMEKESSRVWDYAGDNYVHRLLNDADGKIVELPDKAESSSEGKSKSDSSEYLELLLSQLISQREYYELLLADRLRRGSINDPRAQKDDRVDELTAKMEAMTTNVVPALQKKITIKENSLKIALMELKESQALQNALSEKVDYLAEENKELKAQVSDLSEQVKDLMFFLESREKFKDQPEEVREGKIVMKPGKKKRR